MSAFLKIIGYGWAFIGVANVLVAFPKMASSAGGIVVLLIFNMILFVLPGLICGGIGSAIRAHK